jgi:hypothetical protein
MMGQQIARKQFVKKETFIQQKDGSGFPATFQYCPKFDAIGWKHFIPAHCLVKFWRV